MFSAAFENEMVQRTFRRIRNERWLYDARIMQKHMDLHLIDLLEREKLDQVLDYIHNPQRLYADVLHLLIAEKVPNIDEERKTFKNHFRDAIKKAAAGAMAVNSKRAQTFVNQLRKKILDGYLQSEILGSAFRIDCSGECASVRSITTHKTDLMMQFINQGELQDYHVQALMNWIT